MLLSWLYRTRQGVSQQVRDLARGTALARFDFADGDRRAVDPFGQFLLAQIQAQSTLLEPRPKRRHTCALASRQICIGFCIGW